MRATEFLHATDDEGKMAFRVELPLSERQSEGPAAADGQMGCLLKLYRDWQLCGDDDLLKALWPDARVVSPLGSGSCEGPVRANRCTDVSPTANASSRR